MRFSKHPTSYWLDRLRSPDDETRWEAVDAIRHVMESPGSVRILLNVAECDAYWRSRALALHGICDYLYSEQSNPDAGTEICKMSVALEADSRISAIAENDENEVVRGNAEELLRLLSL